MSTQSPTRDGAVLLTPADAARLAKVSRDTIYREIDRGSLRALHAGGRLYLTIDAVKRADGVREIRKLDVFEISATATPMNAGTRVLSTKAAERDEPPTHRELEAELVRRGIITEPAYAEQYERAGQGWSSFFDRIAERLAG